METIMDSFKGTLTTLLNIYLFDQLKRPLSIEKNDSSVFIVDKKRMEIIKNPKKIEYVDFFLGFIDKIQNSFSENQILDVYKLTATNPFVSLDVMTSNDKKTDNKQAISQFHMNFLRGFMMKDRECKEILKYLPFLVDFHKFLKDCPDNYVSVELYNEIIDMKLEEAEVQMALALGKPI